MGISGLRWMDDLVAKSKAVKLNGNGYPSRYEARAADADAAFRQELAELEERNRQARAVWDSLTPEEREQRTRDFEAKTNKSEPPEPGAVFT